MWCGVVSEEPAASTVGHITVLLETAFYCEALLYVYQNACQHFPVDSNLLIWCCEKVKSHINTFF